MTHTKLVFDPFSQEFFDGPNHLYTRMRDEAPVYYSDEYDFYALSRYEDVAPAYRDHETYSSARGLDLATVRHGEILPHRSIIMMDPPEHRHMRRLVSKVFTPRAIAGLRDTIDEQIVRFLGRVDPAGFDMIQDFSSLFPIEVISEMLGVPHEHRTQVRLWTDDLLHREVGQIEMTEVGFDAVVELARFYYGLAKERRANPCDDMITKLTQAQIERDDDEPPTLSNMEISMFASLLGGAGAETVAKLIGGATVTFAKNPDQWEKVRADRSLIPDAVEELLRFESPNQYNVRYSMRDVELHGVTIPAGKPVLLLLGSANRDPEAFDDADVFDIERDRSGAPSLAFGMGVHSCLGAALARLESNVALGHLLDFMPEFEVDFDKCTRVSMQNVAGYDHVPVRVIS
ncbi:cytochrome P450 [Rhodococcus artemisiae]|uniref:Cytochrome P450 n=1 Tax=Rhodococcus artemisiae TaxID=714159 RepID=A0ABU7LB51_9NOCA|nr:cytochrome P450 [Rhodococcus artemisiae]MEE2058537.1 cytochrome P450 [Rhodococcus artemisiae]